MSKIEWLDIINDKNEIIGCLTKSDAYRLRASHRVVHIMVVSEKGILITRRGLNVSYLPGAFCTSAGGHVQSGETSEYGALRELNEEIGLNGPIEKVSEFYFTHEFQVHITLYLKRYNDSIDHLKLNPNEVDSGKFYDWKEIEELNTDNFHPQLIVCLESVKKYLKTF